MTQERRRHKRHAVESVTGTFQFSTEARVLNMSLDGMSLEASSPLKIGRVYRLRLEQNNRSLPLEGTVVWCTLIRTRRDDRGEVQPVYRAGIHLNDVLSGRAQKLRDFIHQNAIVSLENRMFGRFRLEDERSADLSLEAEFVLRELSASGMLIESDVAPEVGTDCHLEVELGELRFDATAHVTRMERISPTEAEGLERMLLGIQFHELSESSRKALDGFLKSESA